MQQLTQAIPLPCHTKIGSIITSQQLVHWRNFPTMCWNWFSQLHFHFSHQSTTGLSINTTKYPEYSLDLFQNLDSFSVVHNLPIPQISCKSCVHCFDSVDWASEEHLVCIKLSDEVLTWLSVWSEVQMICIWSNWCHCHSIISCFLKIQIGLNFVPAYPGCPGKEVIKRVSLSVHPPAIFELSS